MNAYLLMVIEAIASALDDASIGNLDELFANVRIAEEARERAIMKSKDDKLSKHNLTLVMGHL
jgi:hypothetical protein